MGTLCKTPLAVLLSIAIGGAPSMAASANPATAPLGVVVQSDQARLGGDVVSNGATIYDGDLLQTEAAGLLRANLGGLQMYLRQGTQAEVHRLPNGFSADLKSGTVIVSSKQGQAFELFADGAVVRPSGTDPVVALVTRVNDKQLLLSSSRGALKVDIAGELKTVESGESYRLELENETADSGSQNRPVAAVRSRRKWVLIVGISIGASLGAWRALISEPAP
jgi:hypothetical protein